MDVFYGFDLEGKLCWGTEIIIIIMTIMIFIPFVPHKQGAVLNKDCFQKCLGITDPGSPECAKAHIFHVLQQLQKCFSFFSQ